MEQIKENMMVFLTREEIQDMIAKLASEIEADYEGREVVFVCPLRGSILFAADLTRKVNLIQEVEFIYLRTIESNKTIKIVKDIDTDITGKHVLILEEIIDSGRKLSFLKERLQISNPASLKVVTLLDKPARRELPIKPDYTGMTIDDRYVVGYGMDTEELGRNYSDIYIYKF